MQLEELRTKIDEIDKQMAELFEKRMQIIEQVRIVKKQNNLPILDQNRENNMQKKNANYLNDKQLLPYYSRFLSGVTAISKQYMKDKNE